MSAWLYAISIMGQAVSMMFAGGVEAKVGSKKCTLIGCIGFLLCVACSYWAVCNFYLLMFIYGFMFGFFLGSLSQMTNPMASQPMDPAQRGKASVGSEVRHGV